MTGKKGLAQTSPRSPPLTISLVALVHAHVAAVQRQVAVVNLQRQQRQRRRAEPAGDTEDAVAGLEAALLAGPAAVADVLAGDQHVADAALAGAGRPEVPQLPRLAAHVVHDLRGVVVVVEVAAR